MRRSDSVACVILVANSTVRITGLLLKKGAAAGMTLYDIASIILRSDLDSPSKLENVVDQAFVRTVPRPCLVVRLTGPPATLTTHRASSPGYAVPASDNGGVRGRR